jgi:DNA-3-methyladenine glycosylase II
MSQHIIDHLTRADPVLGGLIRAVGPCVFEADVDCHPFQALAQAIAHQQLNGTAAKTILGRLIESCGGGMFPTPEQLLAAPVDSLRAAGFSFAKAAALRDLAEKTLADVVPDAATLLQLPDEEIITRLTQVRGIGRWTVEMLLIFRLARPDVLPVDDFGVRNGFRLAYGLSRMPQPKALAAWGERWKPYRSTAAWYLWRALELERAGTLRLPADRIRLPRVRKLRRARRAKPSRRKAQAARIAAKRRTAARGAATRRTATRHTAAQRAAGRRPSGKRTARRSRPGRSKA